MSGWKLPPSVPRLVDSTGSGRSPASADGEDLRRGEFPLNERAVSKTVMGGLRPLRPKRHQLLQRPDLREARDRELGDYGVAGTAVRGQISNRRPARRSA